MRSRNIASYKNPRAAFGPGYHPRDRGSSKHVPVPRQARGSVPGSTAWGLQQQLTQRPLCLPSKHAGGAVDVLPAARSLCSWADGQYASELREMYFSCYLSSFLPSAWPHNGTLHEQGSGRMGPGLSRPIVRVGSRCIRFAF